MAEKGRGGRGLALLALVIALVALVISLIAYQRTGGDLQLRQRVESLQQALDSARQETANALDRLEKLLRGSQEQKR